MAWMGEMGCAPPFRPKQKLCIIASLVVCSEPLWSLPFDEGRQMSWMFITIPFKIYFTFTGHSHV